MYQIVCLWMRVIWFPEGERLTKTSATVFEGLFAQPNWPGLRMVQVILTINIQVLRPTARNRQSTLKHVHTLNHVSSLLGGMGLLTLSCAYLSALLDQRCWMRSERLLDFSETTCMHKVRHKAEYFDRGANMYLTENTATWVAGWVWRLVLIDCQNKN